MQKFMRIMAIVAVALAALSLTLLLLTIPLQQWIGEALNYPEESLAALPMLPVLPFVFTLLRTACMALLLVCCGRKKGGVWLEIAVFACLTVVIPSISQFVTPMYSQLLVNMRGSAFVAANSVVNQIANMCQTPLSYGQAIAYAVCGMSFVFKRMSGKAE